MSQDEFSKRNPELEYVLLGTLQPKGDGSLSREGLGELKSIIETFSRPRQRLVVNLEFSLERNRYGYGIYREKK